MQNEPGGNISKLDGGDSLSTILPMMPILPGESFVSWVSRFARVQCDMSAKEFSSFVRIPLQDLARTRDNAVEQMHQLTGIPAERLTQGGYKQLAFRYYKHRDEEFHSEFVAGNRVSYCPQCILNDISDCPQSLRMPVGKINWAFSPVRTCPVHSVPLVREPGRGRGNLFLDLAAHMPDEARLAKLAEIGKQRRVSELQSYLEARLEGRPGPEWLDGQLIDLASRASEMLGACIAFGPNANLPNLSQSDWDLAGAVGYEFTRCGPEGVREGLEAVQKKTPCSKVQAGPQGVFGVLYKWIQFKKNRKPIGPFREVFREHILETMPIGAGTILFGEPVVQRRRHSVVSLSQKFGVHPRTVQNALMVADLLPANYDAKRDFGAIDVARSEDLLRRMRRSVPISEVPKYLGCKRPQVAQLIEAGMLKPIAGCRDGRRSIAQGVDANDLDSFVNRLRSFGQPISEPSEGVLEIANAAEALKVPAVKIVELLLQRQLTGVELLDEELRYQSVLVDVAEVGEKLGCRTGSPGKSISDVARKLGLSANSVDFLLRTPPDGMEPVLTICGQTRHMGQMRDLVSPASVDRFKLDYQKITDVATRMATTVPEARRKLKSRGILPVWEPKTAGVELYRTSEF